jgi:hypothetical protein
VPTGSKLVVLVGGGNDRSAALLPLATAVNRTIGAVRQRAPHARIVVVGPVSPGRAGPPSGVLQVRATLRAAAAATASVHFVDPIAGHWLSSPSAVTSSGRLTPAGKQELARRLTAALAPYVP